MVLKPLMLRSGSWQLHLLRALIGWIRRRLFRSAGREPCL